MNIHDKLFVFLVDCRRRVPVPGVCFIIIPMNYCGLWIIRSMNRTLSHVLSLKNENCF